MMVDQSELRGRLGQNLQLPPDWSQVGFYCLQDRQGKEPRIVHMRRKLFALVPMGLLPGVGRN